MEATVLYGARDVRFKDRPEPKIIARLTQSLSAWALRSR
jgi:hypothetical protein